jgi:hypothetical protein
LPREALKREVDVIALALSLDGLDVDVGLIAGAYTHPLFSST